MRKFEILSIEFSPYSKGPNYHYLIHYKAIVKKKWVQSTLNCIAKNEAEAREKMITRYGGKL